MVRSRSALSPISSIWIDPQTLEAASRRRESGYKHFEEKKKMSLAKNETK